MDTKLTLKLDKQVIIKAKRFAQKKKISLSQVIESYLEKITESSQTPQDEITPLVKSLTGCIILTKKLDSKKMYKDHLTKKYT